MEELTQPEFQAPVQPRWRKLWRKYSRGLVKIVWLGSLFFFVQNALASRLENELRAALLYWMITAVVLLAGGIVAVNRRTSQ